MDWSAIGAVGELLGAAAVVISLVYLGRQIQHSNRIARAEAFRSTTDRAAALLDSWAADPEWAEVVVGIRYQGTTRSDLTPRQRAVAGLRFQSLVRGYAAIHHDVELGILPPSAYDINGQDAFRTPYMQELWPIIRADYSEEFRRMFEGRFGLAPDSESRVELPPGSPETG